MRDMEEQHFAANRPPGFHDSCTWEDVADARKEAWYTAFGLGMLVGAILTVLYQIVAVVFR